MPRPKEPASTQTSYAEAKGTGFDTKIMRQLIKIRKMDKDEHDEQETLLDLYMRAVGMLPEAAASAQASAAAQVTAPAVPAAGRTASNPAKSAAKTATAHKPGPSATGTGAPKGSKGQE